MFRIRSLMAVLFFAGWFAIPCFALDKTVCIVSSEVPPHAGRNLPGQGICIEIINTAFLRTGYTPSFEFFPWQRSMEMVKKGIVHGISNLWYTKERTQWLVYSDRLHAPNTVGFFKPKALKIQFREYKDLDGLSIGYIHGFAYPDEFFRQTQGYVKMLYYDPLEMMQALTHNRIDLALTMKENGKYILATHLPDKSCQYDFLEPAVDTRELFLGISKKADNYMTILNDFNRGLKEILEDGTLEQIRLRHGLD